MVQIIEYSTGNYKIENWHINPNVHSKYITPDNKIGIYDSGQKAYIVPPNLFSDWIDPSGTPYASLELLLTDLNTFFFDIDPISGYSEVNTFADLPDATLNTGITYYVLNETGTWILGTRKQSGLYRSNGTDWILRNDISSLLVDNEFNIRDDVDNTKGVRFVLDDLTTSSIRAITFQDKDYVLANAANVPDNRIVVNQDNASTTLGGVIDSGVEYFIDGVIDTSGITIDVPTTGINLTGYGFDQSQLVCSDNNYNMFSSLNSGNVFLTSLSFETSGTNSKVFDLIGNTGFEAVEMNVVNFNNCTSLGELTAFRQGLEFNTGRFGGTPSLTLSGNWVGGYRATTTICRSIDNSMTDAIFKTGTSFLMNGRFLTDINIDLGTTAPLFDFSPSNFSGANRLEINNALVSRGSVFDPSDTTISPNISASDTESSWIGNRGLENTFQGIEEDLTTEVTTVINTTGVYETLLGTFTPSNLDHFDSPVNGQSRYLADVPKEFKIGGNITIAGGSNDVVSIRPAIFRASDSSTDFGKVVTKTINNLQGGRDITEFILNDNIVLNENDYVFIQVSNDSDTTDVLAELGSFYTISERK